MKNISRRYIGGFTLIELLVVVLIIGILSAVALPKYEKVVWKSRNAQLKTLVKSIVDAQKVCLMTNGKVCDEFSSLDIDLPLTPVSTSAGVDGNVCKLITGAGDTIRKGENFIVVLNNNFNTGGAQVSAVWTEGKYKCQGFAWGLTERDYLACMEPIVYNSIKAGSFCENIESGYLTTTSDPWMRYYKLP